MTVFSTAGRHIFVKETIMLKKTITYTDYNGNERTEDFYFNLTKAEISEMELSVNGGMTEWIQQIINTSDSAEIVKIFKKIILASYGEKSVDGKRFIKSDELRDAFSQTEAYSELFMELLSDEKQASAFVNGIIPVVPEDHKQAENKVVQIEQKTNVENND